MSTDPRVEAAAQVHYERTRVVDRPWGLQDKQVRDWCREDMKLALAAADATDHAAGIVRLDSHHENYIEELDSLMRQHFTKGQE